MRPLLLCILLCGLPTSIATADEAATVATSATASETLRPTLASFSVTVENNAKSAVAARVENAKVTAAVRDALKAAGLPDGDLKSSSLNVGVHWKYVNGDAKTDGFEATNRLSIATHALESVGVYLDAALSAGAREVSAVAFSAEEVDAARHRALAHAVAIAQGDAAAMASAAKLKLGNVIGLSTEPMRGNSEVEEIVVTARGRSVAAPPPPVTSVVIPDITVSATAYGRWRLVPLTP